MKLYNELAEYYFQIEREGRNIDSDISMIQSLLKKIKTPSLVDIGCGTGEHLNLLSKLDIKCTGIDSSIHMIDTAKLRYPDAAEFITSDMKSFSFKDKFDMAISLFGSFDYMINDDDIHSALKNTWNALKPAGIGIFEIWNAVPLREIRRKPLSIVSETNCGGITIKRERGFKLLNYKNRTVSEVNYRYKITGNQIVEDRHIMRSFTCSEIEDFLKQNKLQVTSFYSNTSMEPFSDKSNKIVVKFLKID